MEVVIGKFAGFCPGVSYAVRKANQSVMENKTIYCLGELVHNQQVVNKLKAKGMITVEDIEQVPDGATILFRSHGVAQAIYERAKEKNLKIIDLTCGRVRAVQKKVEKEKEKAFIIILGKKNHPEVIGEKGFAGENSFVIETQKDMLDAYQEYKKTNFEKVYVVAQTTFSNNNFDELVKQIKKSFTGADIIVDKTICEATENRQKEMQEMAEVFHTMIIIGGKNSANTKALVEIAKQKCKNVYHIQTAEDLKNIDFTGIETVGIMAGASTPREIILSVKNRLICH